MKSTISNVFASLTVAAVGYFTSCAPIFANDEKQALIKNSYVISGILLDGSVDLGYYLDGLEKALTNRDIEAYKGYFRLQKEKSKPVEGCTVNLKNGNLSKKTVTGKDGKFSFDAIPAGDYELFAELDKGKGAIPAVANITIRSSANNSKGVRLIELTSAYAIVRGRIVDNNGRPVPNVSVTATELLRAEQHSESMVTPGKWTTKTDANGQYQFWGLPVTNFMILSAYLENGRAAIRNMELSVETDGKIKEKVTVNVPLVTEETLGYARRLIKISNTAIGTFNLPNKRLVENSNLVFPNSKGNVITVDDVALK